MFHFATRTQQANAVSRPRSWCTLPYTPVIRVWRRRPLTYVNGEGRADCVSIEVLRPFRWTTSIAGVLSMQMSPLAAIGVITASIVTCNVTVAFGIPLNPFRYEAQAQRHCPADAV